MRVFVLTLLLLLLPASAAAQVYKCKGRSGETVYSEHPCDARAEPMKLRESAVSAPAPQQSTASDGEREGEGETTTPRADSSELAEARDAERSCISTATASIYGSSNDRVGTLQQQMGMLNEQLATAQDAQRSKALRDRMATFRQAISREHASAHTQMNTARRACIQQHRPGAAPAR